METTYGVHISYFLWSLALGGALALFYDFLRSGRRLKKSSVFRVNMEDILFFLLAGVLLFVTAYDKNGGRLRWQGFLGTAFGAGGYYFIFRDKIVRITVWAIQWLMELMFRCIRILLFPVRVIYRIMAKPFFVITWYSGRSIHCLKRIRKTNQERRRLRSKVKKGQKRVEKGSRA